VTRDIGILKTCIEGSVGFSIPTDDDRVRAVSFISVETATVKAGHYSYTTNFPDTNTITITAYTGPTIGAWVSVPPSIDGLRVTLQTHPVALPLPLTS
jgi:hypothetical protein